MRRSLVAALALAPIAWSLVPTAPAVSPKMPQGELIVRSECFGGHEEESVVHPSPPRGQSGGAARAPSSPPPESSRSTTS